LDTVDRVAESPAADDLPLVAVPRALRLDVVLAEEAGAARTDGADENAVADLIALDGHSDLLDHADRLVADDPARGNRVLAAQDVHVGAADRGHGDAHDRVVGTALRQRALLERDVPRGLEDGGTHRATGATA
jgi:hypothetical protein